MNERPHEATLDLDSDGILDLILLRAGTNAIMKGGPECSFSPFPDLGIVEADDWTTAFSATWEGNNSLPTLAFGN